MSMQTRIKGVLLLSTIINTGYVKERYMSLYGPVLVRRRVRSIFEIMDLTDKENISGLLIFIDFEKAFDSLEWNFLHNCLDVFNFGPNSKRWIKTFLHKY